MRNRTIAVALVFVVAGCSGNRTQKPGATPGSEKPSPKPKAEQPASRPKTETVVRYHAWNESGISVKDGKISSTTTEPKPGHETVFGSRPVPMVRSCKSAPVSDEEVEALVAAFEKCGFFDLPDRFGAPEGERAYPYTLEVKHGARDKRVRFMSGRETKPPAAYKEAVDALHALAKRKLADVEATTTVDPDEDDPLRLNKADQ